MVQVRSEERASEAEWEVWYQDTFDRECPRQVEVAGRGLVEGLIQLWARHLFETVQADGQRGFSRFNLWWKQERRSVVVVGEWEGQARLRRWVYGDERWTREGYIDEGDRDLLGQVASSHARRLLVGESSDAILEVAKASATRDDFVEHLLNLV
jgi:hypothetical protein